MQLKINVSVRRFHGGLSDEFESFQILAGPMVECLIGPAGFVA
jgi:hypothetical protein